MINKIKSKLTHYTWDLAIFRYTPDVILHGLPQITIVKNPFKSKWFADPFILSANENELQVLVEEFDNSIGKGRIARLCIDIRSSAITECKIILELPTHLSFPCIYRRNGKIYVHPENSASGKSIIYEYDKSKDILTNPKTIIDEPLTDAVIIENENGFELYTTKEPTPNGDKLWKYESESFLGNYKLSSIIEFSGCRGRMAGHFINFNGRIIRPAQDCCGSYGKAVVFYDGLDKIFEIRPRSVKYCGVHTFNTCQEFGIIDLKKNDYPIMCLIKDLVKGFIA